MKEEVIEIDVKDISDFKKYPFKINNDLNYELDERLEYTFDIISRVNKYLTKKYKLVDGDLTDYNIFVVWTENENELSRQIDDSN